MLKRTEFEGRPRMAVRVSSNGKLVYVYVAGATVDIWDAATHKYLRTMALGGDQTTELFVVPGAPRPRPPRRGRWRDAARDHADARREPASGVCISAPYWRRLSLVMAISLVSTGLSLVTPYLSKDLVDRALVGRDLSALWRIVGLFAALGVGSYVLNVVSGLRYTRVSAAILFDMRLAVYSHLQQLSPRFYARTRLGDIVSRLNSDIGEIQRVAAEAALAWVGNVLFLAGCIVMLVWLDWRLALVTAAAMPLSLWMLVRYRRRLEVHVADLRQRSADIGSFLIETLQASTLVVTSNAQERERGRFTRAERSLRRRADGDAAAHLPGRRPAGAHRRRSAPRWSSSTAGRAWSRARSRSAPSPPSWPTRCG